MHSTRVGIREFRENLSAYLESHTPVAITRHGATIGIYIPTRRKPSEADLEALRAAGEKMQRLIAAAGTSDGEIVAEFKKSRRGSRRSKS
jgi:antitoxin (DNA-binding transcriptional repressor) of toxin-antitoxin stability system